MNTFKQYSLLTLLLLSLINIPSAFSQGFRSCEDDDFFTFGRDSAGVQRTCSYISQRSSFSERKALCELPVQFSNGLLVQDKCPKTCELGLCGFGQNPKPLCSMDYPASANGGAWYDSIGPDYDCKFYSFGRNCILFGNGYDNFGRTANDACCVCGGGCTDLPVRRAESEPKWTDSRGFDCNFYAKSNTACETDGNSFRNDGLVANEACCVCNGGILRNLVD